MKNISLIGMPIWYGCDVMGGEKTFNILYDKFDNIFSNNKIVSMQKISELPCSSKFNFNTTLKYLDNVISMNKELYNTILNSLSKNFFPIIIGGDHSLAIGSVSASLDFYDGDVSLIWIDAHTDIHTDLDTPSGNIHGIPVSACIGRCSNPKLQICNNLLKPSNIFYIGCRDNDKSREIEEKNYIDKENIFYCTDKDLEAKSITSVINELKNRIKTKYVHISFDFDVIKDDEFPAVNVLATNKYVGEGGISFDMANNLLKELLINDFNVSAIDLVEYNYRLDLDLSCLDKYIQVLKTIDESFI